MKCKYRYKSEEFKNKKCPYDALPGSDYCIWHQKKDGKDFSGQKIEETDLIEAYLVKANLEGAKFRKGTNLEGSFLQGANLRKADLQEADLKRADLQEANLLFASLQGAFFEFTNTRGTNFTSTNLQGAFLEFAELQEANLLFANLQGAYFKSANLKEAQLGFSNLEGAYLESAKLQRASLRYAKIEKANLSDANLQGADIRYVNLEKTNLSEADLRTAFLYATEIKNTEGLQHAEIGDKYIEEIIGDNLHKILKANSKYEIALKRFLYPPLKELKIEEDEINQFASKKTKIYIITSKSRIPTTLKELYDERNSVAKLDILQYRFDLYNHSRDLYISLKNYFKNIGWYDKSGTYFIGEYRVRGKINKLSCDMAFYELLNRIKQFKVKQFFNKLTFWRRRKEPEPSQEKNDQQGSKKFWVLIGDVLINYFSFSINRILSIISLYGESVWRVFFTAFSIILIYASIYSLRGSIIGTDTAVPVHNFWTNLYFSIVTFTTLGYGDLHPISSIGIRLLAGSEAFLGAFILAYFVVVVSRKIMR